MKLNNFEKHLRNRLRNQVEEVDVSKIMDAIPATKPSKNRPFIIWIGAFLAISVFAYGFYSYSTTENDVLNKDNFSQKLSENSTPAISNNNYSSSNKSTVASSDKSIASSTSKSKININNTEEKKNIQNLSSKKISSNSYTNLTTNQTNQSYNNSTEKSHSKSNQFYSDFDSNNNTTSQNLTSQSDLHNASSVSSYTTNKINVLNKKVSTSELAGAEINLLEIAGLLSTQPRKVNCPAFKDNPWIFDAGIGMGISNPTKNLDLKDVQYFPQYSSRILNEKTLEGVDLELFFSAKRASWPVIIKTGFNYTRISERMQLDEQYTQIDTVQGIISTTVSQSGDTITHIYGDIYEVSEYTIKKRVHYYLHQLDIPVSLVWEKEIGNHSILVEGGTRINFYTLAKGQIFKQNTEFTSVSRPNYFKRLTGFSYFGKLHYRYYLRPSQYIGMQSYYHHIPADFSSSNNGISQKYFNYGIGVYYGFRF